MGEMFHQLIGHALEEAVPEGLLNPKMGFSLDMDSIDQDQQKQLPSAVYQLLLLLSHFSCVQPKQLVLPFTQSDSEFPCESWMS